MTNDKIIAEKLLHIGAVKLSPQKPFTWASGWKSPIYCDNRKVLSFPYIRDFIKSEMCNILFEQFSNSEILAGVATAGIPWGAMAADQLKLPFIYVRTKPKDHGLGNQIEGHYETGKKVIVIEDLISTAKSSLEVVEVLKNAGMKVEGMVSIFNYGFEQAQKAIEASGIKYYSLTNYTALISVAIEKGTIGKENEELLNSWRMDPSNWQGI